MAPPESVSDLGIGELKQHTEGQELNVSTLETSLKLVVRVGEIVLDVLVFALAARLLVEVEAIAGVDLLLLSHIGGFSRSNE